MWYTGEFRAANHRGIEYGAGFEIGKFSRPKIVPNSNLKYDANTGLPQGPEMILSGSETVFEIEVPKGKEARKKLIDSIINDNDNHQDSILYYVRHLNESNYEQSRDHSFNYEQFVNLAIEDLIDTSQKGVGAKSSPYFTDKDGILRYKKTDTPVTSKSNKDAYQ